MRSWQFWYVIVYAYGFSLLLDSVHTPKLYVERADYRLLQNTSSVFTCVKCKT